MLAIAPAIPTASDRYVLTRSPGDLVKDLRLALKKRAPSDWTQKAMARRARFKEPEYVTRVEIGANKLTSKAMHDGMARAFGITTTELDAYLDGRVTVAQVVARILDNAPLQLPGAAPATSLGFIERGKTLDDAQPELKKLIATDAIPAEHRSAIPKLMRLEYAIWRHFDTPEGWLAEARRLAETPSDAAPNEDVAPESDEDLLDQTHERVRPALNAHHPKRRAQ